MRTVRSITIPSQSLHTYPCESINKVVSEETLPSLTKAERRAAYVELSTALFAIRNDIQLAINRAALPANHLNYRPIEDGWMNRAKKLRSALGDLLAMIRRYEEDLPMRAIEVEAIERRRNRERRVRRQQNFIDAFTQLVEKDLGAARLQELLQQAGVLADEWTREKIATAGTASPTRMAMSF